MRATSGGFLKARGYALLLILLLTDSNTGMMMGLSQPPWTLNWKPHVKDSGQRVSFVVQQKWIQLETMSLRV